MLLSGEEYLESLRDGRVVYLGGERVDDVTRHRGFRNAARSFAMIYDVKKDSAHRELLAYEDEGELHSMYWLMPRSRDDLVRRLKAHEYIADLSYGLLGRTPDFYAGFVVALAINPGDSRYRETQVRRQCRRILQTVSGQ